jgi:hypothetical protein
MYLMPMLVTPSAFLDESEPPVQADRFACLCPCSCSALPQLLPDFISNARLGHFMTSAPVPQQPWGATPGTEGIDWAQPAPGTPRSPPLHCCSLADWLTGPCLMPMKFSSIKLVAPQASRFQSPFNSISSQVVDVGHEVDVHGHVSMPCEKQQASNEVGTVVSAQAHTRPAESWPSQSP